MIIAPKSEGIGDNEKARFMYLRHHMYVTTALVLGLFWGLCRVWYSATHLAAELGQNAFKAGASEPVWFI